MLRTRALVFLDLLLKIQQVQFFITPCYAGSSSLVREAAKKVPLLMVRPLPPPPPLNGRAIIGGFFLRVPLFV